MGFAKITKSKTNTIFYIIFLLEKYFVFMECFNIKKIIYLQPKNSNDGYKGVEGAI